MDANRLTKISSKEILFILLVGSLTFLGFEIANIIKDGFMRV